MTTHIVPLVGMHFRPPAKAILQVLPAACPLRVIPEPDNPYDEFALAVHVATQDIPTLAHQELDSIAAPFGFDLASILAAESWHLGYVKATEAKWLQPLIIATDPAEAGGHHYIPAALAFDSAGKPAVKIEV